MSFPILAIQLQGPLVCSWPWRCHLIPKIAVRQDILAKVGGSFTIWGVLGDTAILKCMSVSLILVASSVSIMGICTVMSPKLWSWETVYQPPTLPPADPGQPLFLHLCTRAGNSWSDCLLGVKPREATWSHMYTTFFTETERVWYKEAWLWCQETQFQSRSSSVPLTLSHCSGPLFPTWKHGPQWSLKAQGLLGNCGSLCISSSLRTNTSSASVTRNLWKVHTRENTCCPAMCSVPATGPRVAGVSRPIPGMALEGYIKCPAAGPMSVPAAGVHVGQWAVIYPLPRCLLRQVGSRGWRWDCAYLEPALRAGALQRWVWTLCSLGPRSIPSQSQLALHFPPWTLNVSPNTGFLLEQALWAG